MHRRWRSSHGAGQFRGSRSHLASGTLEGLHPAALRQGPVILERGGGRIEMRVLGRAQPRSRRPSGLQALRHGTPPPGAERPPLHPHHPWLAVPIPWYEEWRKAGRLSTGVPTRRGWIFPSKSLRRRPRNAGSGDGYLSADLARPVTRYGSRWRTRPLSSLGPGKMSAIESPSWGSRWGA